MSLQTIQVEAGTGRAWFWCPGCQTMHHVTVPPHPQCWGFSGDLIRPTLSPSVKCAWHTWDPPATAENLNPGPQRKVDHCCHFFVTNGRIAYLTDCTHALRGRTVDMVPLMLAAGRNGHV